MEGMLFACNACNKSFVYKRNFRQHQRFKCNKPPQFGCPVCLRRFTSKGYLKYHVAAKHGLPNPQDKKFKCMKCDKAYKHKPNLYRHSKYECDGVPRFVCEICGKAYTQKVTLKQHVDSLHLTAVFKFDKIFQRFSHDFQPKRDFK
ncbi:hypothetical protein HUJ04_008567 [Dendroctonus ponderosae]|nr:hypothetical protein HUJ04_008567 [Dendroctonus ponderosae]KAH1008472.1 hypothetical protein HUJ05_009025 [Dendroctonus ponderosae]